MSHTHAWVPLVSRPRSLRPPIAAAALYGVFVLVASVAAGCGGGGAVPLAAPPVAGPMPTAAELFAKITVDDPFAQWAQFPDATGNHPSLMPHAPATDTRVNAVGMAAFNRGNTAWPAGTIIVKQNLMGGGTGLEAAAWTVMWKVPGFDAANNDWFWAILEPDGTVNDEGSIVSCNACHGFGAAANDSVFLQQL